MSDYQITDELISIVFSVCMFIVVNFVFVFTFRMKKEVGKKDAELDTNMVQYHTEM